MPEHFYRFRSNVLGKHQELENQEIFFSTLESLNDPMEGFIDLFWSGDYIVWENLLRHYLLCLDRACIQFMLIGETEAINLTSIPVLQTDDDLPTQESRDLYKRICGAFLAIPAVPEYVKGLSSRTRPIRRDELRFHLRILHYHALNAIFSAYKDRGVMTPGGDAFQELLQRISLRPEIFEATKSLEARHPEVPDGSDRLYAAATGVHLQQVLIAKFNNPAGRANRNGNLIFDEFPDRYLKLLERMVYGDWYMACFSESCSNSSMWGHYANNHKGVCLKFAAATTVGQESSLALNTITGIRGSKANPNGEFIHNFANRTFHKVNYQGAYPAIDFFRSLGRLRGIALSWWYSDGRGNNSSCAHDVHGDEAKWTEKYWAELLANQTSKLEDWSYEKEYRLVLNELIIDFADPLKRKLKYRFSDLKGIIFGMNTPEEDKLAIIRVIQEKCRKENREDFEFYQAYYAKHPGSIEAVPLTLIKMSKDKTAAIPKIAILGWGSLLWDKSESEFDQRHEEWKLDGPVLKLEFSRKSSSRLNALTLVIDPIHGQECTVASALSRRGSPEEAIADLCAREKTKEKNIGWVFADGSRRQGRDSHSLDIVSQWAKDRSIDVVIWTDLGGSFDGVAKADFVKAAVAHVQHLPAEGKAQAAEYVWQAPEFIVTPLRNALQVEPWFQKQ
jgi:hypothetical protein